MALTTYGELKTEVADWLNRADLTDRIPLFIRLAEAQLYQDLRCDENEFVARYNNTTWQIDGHPPAAVSDGIHVILPPNYRELTLVQWNGAPLDPLSENMLQRHLVRGLDPLPRYFALSNRKIAFSQAIPTNPADWGDGDELIYTYYGEESLDASPTWHVSTNPVENPPVEDNTPQDLTQSDNNTTRMFQRFPNAYLFGAMYYAGLHLQDDTMAAKWRALFMPFMDALKDESDERMFSGGIASVSSAYSD